MRRALVVAFVLGVAVAWPRGASARRGVRPLFEPTDLELEEPGTVELDVQVGLVRGQGPWRLVVPDFELDVGLLRNLEVDVDGAYALEAPAGAFRFDSAAPDNLWIAAKLGLFDWVDEGRAPDDLLAWAVGAQAGPKLPVAPGSHGVGVEGLVLVAHVVGRAHFVFNAGAFVDPHPAPGTPRPVGLELGLAFDRDLDARGRFQVTAALAGVRFTSRDPSQLLATAGLAWSPNPDTQVALTSLWGFLDGNDRYGALVGLSQKLRSHP